jgi:hypothetical protein
MQKLITTFLFCFILTQSFSQTQRNVSTYLLAQYNHTIYDYTTGNNPWGIGLGLQTFFNNKSKLRATIELTGDLYFVNDKVFRSNPDGTFPANGNEVGGMVNLFAGLSLHPTQSVYLSIIGGPSFISGQPYFGIKPSAGFYFSKNQRWMGKVSYINVFDRTKIVNEDFGSLSLAIGLKLF